MRIITSPSWITHAAEVLSHLPTSTGALLRGMFTYDYTTCILCLEIVERNTEVSSCGCSQPHNREEALLDLQGVVYKLAAPYTG